MRTVLIFGFILAAGGGCALAANPTSNNATNILPGSPTIASQLPTPQVSSNTVGSYLDAASAALMAGETGQAQEALEDAETQALDRSVPYSAGGQAISDPVVNDIYQARQALGMKDISGALAAVAAAKAAMRGA